MPPINPPWRSAQNPFMPLSAPSDPPTTAEVAEAVAYERVMTEFYARTPRRNRRRFERDVTEASAYKTKVVARRAGLMAAQYEPGAPPPPWFKVAVNDTLRPTRGTLRRLEQEMGRVEKWMERIRDSSAIVNRRLAILCNKSRSTRVGRSFEVVPFQDLWDPEAVRRLPPLTSRAVIEGLTMAQIRDYYNGYYPGGRHRRADHLGKIYEAIGVRRRRQV
ncbi:hypothetical protein BD779DRAFT_1476872 [Infundibulicybe gibba]|nr:hypothetical protein BD779DRAFT_1476872 [Infundibulicybe gibba]